ncbi:putative aminopeptidase-2 [Halictus rubicundus]|uniref:putative aminopeptidase-2 n=1 Tax=Halictus rubicundus TaxID=77578 RepID=UPI004036263D
MTGFAVLSLIALWSVSWTGTEALARLTGVSVPNVYNIHLEPNFMNNTFKGNLTVDFHVTMETSAIAINQKNLNITNITMGKIGVSEWMLFHNTEILVVYFDQLLKLHEKYSMNILYEGILGTKKYGFYRSNYTDGTETKWIATTHFEPSGARRAFPCWDEPQYKAVFDISITHLKNYTTVLSNMPICNQTDNGEAITTYFDRTMKMSTYLVAFIVSDYAYIPHTDDRIRIYTKPNSAIYTDYAWNFTERALKVMDEYTEMPYFNFMPKIDHVAVVDFDAAGMENWGLVIYKEVILLYEEGVTTTAHKEEISKVIAHEVAHQWFGNLVSPEWWDHVWVKEGIAYYLQSYILDKLEPTWRVMDMFVVETMQWGSFLVDTLGNVQPMDTNVETRDEIKSVFDEIAYQKASCVIRMFSHILSEEIFRKGLKTYLEEYKFSFADSTDLLNHLNDAFGTERDFAGRSFREVADDWVTQPGFPLVTVTRVSPGTYSLRQERLTVYGNHSDKTKWWIPITYATNHKLNFTNTTVTHWLTPENLTIIEPDSNWIVVNKQQMGYYRVNYDEETWHTLSNVLKSDMHQIHPINRAQLIDDVFTMAHKNMTKYETALSLALYLTQEIDYVPWTTAFRHLETLPSKLFHTKHYQIFKHYVRFLMHSLTTNVTYEAWSKDDHPTKILKAQAMNFACLADVKECLDSAQRHFNAWLKDPHYKIDPELRDTIICTGLRTASQAIWDKARMILEKVKFDPESRKNPLEVLGCTNNPEILKKFVLDSTKPDSKIDFSDAVAGVIANSNVSGIDIVQEVMERDFDKIGNMDDFKDYVTAGIRSIAAEIVNTKQLSKLGLFITQNTDSPGDMLTLLEKSNRNILWIRAHANRIDKWLVDNEEIFSSSGRRQRITVIQHNDVRSVLTNIRRTSLRPTCPSVCLISTTYSNDKGNLSNDRTPTEKRIEMTGFALLSLIALWSVSWTGTEALARLTGAIIPDVYQIHLEPNFVTDTFKGNVTVEIHAMTETSVIALHQKELNVTNITMVGIGVKRWRTLHDIEILVVYFDEILKLRTKYYMNIVYEGILGTDRYGFYRSRYTDGTETKWIATTHFEPSGARRAFPCWDEPQYKAAFDISIRHLKNYTAVASNMPIIKQTDEGEYSTTYFYRTMNMSTYLVAFIVSDYAYIPHTDDRIRIYTKPNSVIYTDYAWNFTERALKVMDEYTEMPYFNFMRKIDHVAIVDFDHGAMENWGLVTYRETMLLYEEGVTTTAHKQIISKTIAHEIAHQWFGNLVSPEWWDYIWLNEGFAHYFEVYILDKLEPTWRIMDMFAVDTIQAGSFAIDAKTHAPPMNRHVVGRNEIMSVFDGISYLKASCVIRMFSHILSEEIFRKGLKTYLEEYKFRVADSNDLLYRLSDAFGSKLAFGGKVFHQVANFWVTQPGFPLVTVTRVSPGHYSLSQQRFKVSGNHSDKTKWWIPITYATNHKLNFTNTTVTHWLTPENLTIIEPDSNWIVVNKQQMGYYRVNYDEETWHNLSNVLKSDMHQIHPVNRAQLIDDVFAAAQKNITKFETALSLALYLTQEIDYVPWMTAFRNLETLRSKLYHVKHYQIFKHYIRFLMHSLTTNVTYEAWSKDDHPTRILRSQAMKWACLADVKECLDSARRRFTEWLNDPHHKIDPDLANTIICTGLRTASEALWDKVRKILEKVKFDPESGKNPLEVLGCSNNPNILKKFLVNSTEEGSKIEFINAAKGVIANTNVSGVDIVQEVINFEFEEDVDIDHFLDQVTPAIPLIAESVVNTKQFFKLSLFSTQTEANPDDTSKVLETSNRNILWIRAYANRIDKWLVENEKLFNSSGTLVFTSFLLIFSIFTTQYF